MIKIISLYPKYMLIKHCHLNSAQVNKDTEIYIYIYILQTQG